MHSVIRKALEAIGDRNRYQYLMTLLFLFLNYFANFIIIGGTFIFMNPLFRCSFSDSLEDESVACPRISECEITSDFTITARLELYCDQQFERNSMQSVLALGSVVGLLVTNYISDHWGKKVSILLIEAVAIVGFAVTLAGGEWKLISLVLIGQTCCGFSSFSIVLSSYIYPSECCHEVFRQRAVVSVNYSWCLTFCLLGVLYYWCNYWRDFLLYFCLIPLLVTFVVTFFFLVEGPNFLYSQNKIPQCLDSLRFIARVNGRMEQFQRIKDSITVRKDYAGETTTVLQNLRLVLGQWKYLKKVLILIMVEFGGNVYYFGGNYALDQIGFEYGTNLIGCGIIEVFGFATLNLVIEKVPRKKAIFFFYSLLALFGMLFLIPTVRDAIVGQAVILGISRYIITMAYLATIITLTESFPMQVQSVCSGIVESLAQLGIFVGPIVVTFCINLQIYPMIVFSGFLIIFVVLPIIGLDQTLKTLSQKSEPLLQEGNEANESNGRIEAKDTNEANNGQR